MQLCVCECVCVCVCVWFHVQWFGRYVLTDELNKILGEFVQVVCKKMEC